MNRTFFAFKCGVIWICGGDFVYLRTNKGYIVCDGEGTMLVINTQYMMGYTLLPYIFNTYAFTTYNFINTGYYNTTTYPTYTVRIYIA